MKIVGLQVNHLDNPMGYRFDALSLSWRVQDTVARFQRAARVRIFGDPGAAPLYDSGWREDADQRGFQPDLALSPRTRYYWQVGVTADDGETALSDLAWFETGKLDEPWRGVWISPAFSEDIHPYIRRGFILPGLAVSARAYASGLGLYRLEINGRRVGGEYLTPYCGNYDANVQYQTYDVLEYLRPGQNTVGFMLGSGWYKGEFGFHRRVNAFGSQFSALCELRVTLADGSEWALGSDETWQCAPSPVLGSGIYLGEVRDAAREIDGWSDPECPDDGRWTPAKASQAQDWRLIERISPPVVEYETLAPALIHTPKGECVLDFGQNIAGSFCFETEKPAGSRIVIQCGEILQEGCFYRDNLRGAEAKLEYTCDGRRRFVRPEFTYFGFRYLRVQGMTDDEAMGIRAVVMHTQMADRGWIETASPKVNRLFLNALWGQRGNFVDVPTDCPQRDERMGWTGDAQIFCMTGCYNLDAAAFYQKYMSDLREEQKLYDGCVPYTVPDIRICRRMRMPGGGDGSGSCAWGDAAVNIPWTLYLMYGDRAQLEQNYPCMRDWTEYIISQDEADGGHRLWRTGFHFADWLALDNPDRESRFGGTDPYFVASCCYYASTLRTGKAARVLGCAADAARYEGIAAEIKRAIAFEYFTPAGRLAADTQTGYVLALGLDLVPESFRARAIRDFEAKMYLGDGMNGSKAVGLTTGFVGTPALCPALSESGLNDVAYALLLKEDYPSWLYEVNMGATTIWERWNSVLPDGRVSDTGMNSMNHYSLGSVVEWMYRYMCGIRPCEESPGFRRALIAPMPNPRLPFARAACQSPYGMFACGWRYEDGKLRIDVEVPFNAEAVFNPPEGVKGRLYRDGAPWDGSLLCHGRYQYLEQ